ncbi:MAG: response regulator [Campylobacterota bacterium]|nr:response regulator [Campylobacterota bacterium]
MSDLTILLVDDEKDITDKYAKHLKRKYSNVYSSYDGLDAYKIYKDISPDIIILDLHLPKLSGIDLLRRIRKTDNKTEVIICSAFSEDCFLQKAKELGVVKYFVKPFSREELNSTLIQVVEDIKERGKKMENIEKTQKGGIL